MVWDFDWSLINENSDTYVLQELAPALMKELGALQEAQPRRFGRGQWTALMDHLMTKLGTEHGIRKAELETCLEGIPIFEENVKCVREAAAAGFEQRILSDANTVFIEKIVARLGLVECFSCVATNAGTYERRTEAEAEVLRVRPYVPRDRPPHGCALCPPNLCKGAVLDAWIEELRPSKIVYVGDGSGDFCPALHLSLIHI